MVDSQKENIKESQPFLPKDVKSSTSSTARTQKPETSGLSTGKTIIAAVLLTSFALYGLTNFFDPFSLSIPKTTSSSDPRCQSSTFQPPTVFGARIVSISATPVSNFSVPSIPGFPRSKFHPDTIDLSFCNVTATYTHPGLDDLVTLTLWLPPKSSWNGRFQGTSGGGFSAHLMPITMPPALAIGYAAAATDAGLALPPSGQWMDATGDPSSWALLSPGNVNIQSLTTFGSRALHELAVIGKALTTSYYEAAPKKSYWNGCSTGGRQGLMLAQRYPDDFDGILASAPAINMDKFVLAEYYPQMIMDIMGEWPHTCELRAITEHVVKACDKLDGLEDGIISDPDKCHFDPYTVVGEEAKCAEVREGKVKISSAAAKVAKATWKGARDDKGDFLWYGLNPGTDLIPLAGANCSKSASSRTSDPDPMDMLPSSSEKCTSGSGFSIAHSWVRYFLLKDPTVNLQTTVDHAKYTQLHQQAIEEYYSAISTSNPDLSAFRSAGGKMMTWHGLGDTVIFPNGTRKYYEEVLELDPAAREFYRYYEAPGVGHCSGGKGAYPGSAFDSAGALDDLVAWVEEGKVPEVLYGVSDGENVSERIERPICTYPLVARYKGKGHDPKKLDSFECAESY